MLRSTFRTIKGNGSERSKTAAMNHLVAELKSKARQSWSGLCSDQKFEDMGVTRGWFKVTTNQFSNDHTCAYCMNPRDNCQLFNINGYVLGRYCAAQVRLWMFSCQFGRAIHFCKKSNYGQLHECFAFLCSIRGGGGLTRIEVDDIHRNLDRFQRLYGPYDVETSADDVEPSEDEISKSLDEEESASFSDEDEGEIVISSDDEMDKINPLSPHKRKRIHVSDSESSDERPIMRKKKM